MNEFDLNLDGDICMDIGASTGGFTDCMLQNGASKVYSVDGRIWSVLHGNCVRSRVCMYGKDEYPLCDEEILMMHGFCFCGCIFYLTDQNPGTGTQSAKGLRTDGLPDQATV